MSNILRCNNCSGQLSVIGKEGPKFQVSCKTCGLDSNYVSSAIRNSLSQGTVTIVRKRSPHKDEQVSSPYSSWR